MSPKGPVVLITGTPGTGKSTTAQLLAQESPVPLQHINVGEWVKEKGLHEGFDTEWQSYIVDDDKVSLLIPDLSLPFTYLIELLDELEPIASNGGIILDWHTCELFPERWIDLVVVLRCDHTLLWERMETR
jgi:adenylate kinase